MGTDNLKGEPVRTVEKLLLEPWQSVFRIAYGFGVALLIQRLRPGAVPMWELLLLFLAALFLLRIMPLVPRKVLPFSKALKAAWFEQRQLAKRYDSYQWAKLLWIGFGIGAHVLYSGRPQTNEGALALACILAGGLGTMMWLRAQAAVKRLVSAATA